MSRLSDLQGQLRDTAASIPRQFDNEEGGGFADEWEEIADPTQRTSDETESDVRSLTSFGIPSVLGTGVLLRASDYLDGEAGRDAPGSWPSDGDGSGDGSGDGTTIGREELAEYWGQVFRGNTPTEQAGEEADRAGSFLLSQAVDSPYITIAVIGLIGLVLLYLLRPLLTIGANVSG